MSSNTKRRAGDRNEGRLLRSLPAFNRFTPYIMKTRNDAMLFYDDSFDVAEADKILRQLRVQGYKGIGLLHFIIAAYIRCVSMLPGVNRFVAGRRIFARNGIEVVMVVKKDISLNAAETAIKVHFQPTDTIIDVYRKLNEKIEEIKTAEITNGTEDVAETLCRLPRFLLKFVVGLLRVLDYFGLVPESLLEASPFHGSMIISDLGSLRIGPVYHHLYNFGTLPVFIAFGAKHHKYEVDRHGNTVDKKLIDCKFVLDERICDGHYYSRFLQAMRYIFAHPTIVLRAPNKVAEDIR